MTALAVWVGTIAASLLAIRFSTRVAAHAHQRGEHPSGRCWICGGSMSD